MRRSGESGLVKCLGLLDSTTLVMGSMIGSGIFIVSADIARQTQSPGLLIVTWLVAAALTLIAALSYGELAAAMPHAGGQYVYLREAFGPLSGFLFGWTTFMVIQTGTIAAVAVAFAKYTGVFVPWISTNNYLLGKGKLGLNTQQALAIAVIVLLTVVNARGIRTGAAIQNVFTFAKTAALLCLIAFGFLLALGTGKIVSSILFQVSPLDPFALTLAPVVLALAALLATWLPARRATRIGPMAALPTDPLLRTTSALPSASS